MGIVEGTNGGGESGRRATIRLRQPTMGNPKKNATLMRRKDKELTVNSRGYMLHNTMQNATLGSGANLADCVKLPKGEELNEWLAVHCVEFYNAICVQTQHIADECTAEKYPTTNAGPKFSFKWKDDAQYPKPTSLPAPEYIELSLNYIETTLYNESIFPPDEGTPFPKNFRKEVVVIFKRIFRIYAIIYHEHFKEIEKLGQEANLNTSFKHFMWFTAEFKLVSKADLAPLQDLIQGYKISVS